MLDYYCVYVPEMIKIFKLFYHWLVTPQPCAAVDMANLVNFSIRD